MAGLFQQLISKFLNARPDESRPVTQPTGVRGPTDAPGTSPVVRQTDLTDTVVEHATFELAGAKYCQHALGSVAAGEKQLRSIRRSPETTSYSTTKVSN